MSHRYIRALQTDGDDIVFRTDTLLFWEDEAGFNGYETSGIVLRADKGRAIRRIVIGSTQAVATAMLGGEYVNAPFTNLEEVAKDVQCAPDGTDGPEWVQDELDKLNDAHAADLDTPADPTAEYRDAD